MTSSSSFLDEKYARESGVVYVSGTEALVRLPMDQHRADRRRGVRTGTFISGYRGSPLAGIDTALDRAGRFLEEHHIVFVNGVNEELAATSVMGSQLASTLPGAKYDGVVGIWYGKAPGVERSGDALRHGNFAGIDPRGGVLCLGGDDPSCKSSTLPSSTEASFANLCMPVVYPGTVQEILDLGQQGVMLSRFSGLWVAMKIVTDVADEAATAEVSPERVAPVLPEFEVDGWPYRSRANPHLLPPLTVELEREMRTVRLEAARVYARANRLDRVIGSGSAWLGIVAGGKTYYDVREALGSFGLRSDADLAKRGLRLLKIGMMFPLDREAVAGFARGLEEIVVVEEKEPFLETAIRDVLYDHPERPRVVGKHDEGGERLLPRWGELDADAIAGALAARISRRVTFDGLDARTARLEAANARPAFERLARVPYFCSGCPHNRSTLVPEGSTAAGGIGCHAMALWMDRRNVGTTQMGGEGATWIGLAPFTETKHIFQNIGDGTLAHSGSLALSAAVASGRNITYKILYNSAVAMTGGQQAAGLLPVPDLTRRLEAEGVRRIIVTTEDPERYEGARLADVAEVWHRDRLNEAQRVLRDVPGTTVLIHDQRCAAESRRLRKRGKLVDSPVRVIINEAICEGCGDCGRKSNCMSVVPVETELGRKTQIHQSSCNKDYSCLLGDCPSFVTVEEGEAGTHAPRALPAVPDDLPEPERPAFRDRSYSVFMAGIGGTGVVTVNRLLGVAALFEGRRVSSLDQTGLAQKGGPVVSHLKILEAQEERANRVGTADGDLYLAFDLLVGTDPKNLLRADPERTVAVVNTTFTPTGPMVSNPEIGFPDRTRLLDALREVTRGESLVTLPATEVADALFGDHMATNLIVLGAASQAGRLPIAPASIEAAIRVNGVGVEANVRAFRWGRFIVARPREALAALRAAERGSGESRADADPPPQVVELVARSGLAGEIRRFATLRVAELIRYQNIHYAQRYLSVLQNVASVEKDRVPGLTRFSEAVARNLYKLMAYKDEYEVARLHLESLGGGDVDRSVPGGRAVYWHLHPPFLRALGLRRKLRIPRWQALPLFRCLRALRGLRGTPLDPFGWTRMRRLERALVEDYRRTIARLTVDVRPESYDAAVAVAEAPDLVRGYEEVKVEAIQRYRKELVACLVRFEEATRRSRNVA